MQSFFSCCHDFFDNFQFSCIFEENNWRVHSISLQYREVTVHNSCMLQFDPFQTRTTANKPLVKDKSQIKIWNQEKDSKKFPIFCYFLKNSAQNLLSVKSEETNSNKIITFYVSNLLKFDQNLS